MDRDDIIEYSEAVQHSDEEGKVIRKKLWKVFWILLIVTVVEVIMGAELAGIEKYAMLLKISFIIFTIVKAGYIVLVFMHLGDELKFLRWIILIPYCAFILYLLFICIWEADLMFRIAKIFGT